MATGRPFRAKLFLEGIEVPFIGASITHSINSISIAYIDLVPHQIINAIKPRTHVLLSVRDFTNPSENYPYITAWEGEVFGLSFGKTATSRTFSISCFDYTSYWDNVLTYFFNTKNETSGGAERVRSAMNFALATALGIDPQTTATSKASLFRTYIDKVLKDPEKDFLDAIVDLVRHISGINDFYLGAEERLKISKRLRIRSSGSLNTLIRAAEAKDWFDGVIDRRSGFSTLREVVVDLLSIIFHNFMCVPFPSKAGGSTKNFLFTPNMFFLPPPMCNVFYPDEYSSFNFSRNFMTEPTRLVVKPNMPISQQGVGGLAAGVDTQLEYSYEPPNFEIFMRGAKSNAAYKVGRKDTDVQKQLYDKIKFRFGAENKLPLSEYAEPDTAVMQEGQFLTNEELYKGIIMPFEDMVYASNEFSFSVSQAGRRSTIDKYTKYLFYKKRFVSRQLQITSHLKMSVLPGFSVLLLDDSEAGQNVVAYCTSVTHRIYAQEGGYTNVSLSYARTVDEQDAAGNGPNEPLIPDWFAYSDISNYVYVDESKGIEGFAIKQPTEDTTLNTDTETPDLKKTDMASVYKTLIGDKGYKPVTVRTKKPSLSLATKHLIDEYKTRKKNGEIMSLIEAETPRKYVKIAESFKMMGATPSESGQGANSSVNVETTDKLIQFKGGRFSDPSKTWNATPVYNRRAVIENYLAALKAQRGFRG